MVDSEWDIKAPNFQGALSGTATNSTNVNVLSTTMASGTNYYPIFATSNSGNQRMRAYSSLKIPGMAGNVGVWKNLYENATGTTGNVTLSETCANFTYLQIFSRRDTDGITQWCSWVWQPNGKTFQIGGVRNGSNGDGVWYFAKQVKANGTKLEVSYSKFAGITNTLQVQFGDDTSHYIVKVIGWK